jgi:zinc transporter ZupT
MKKSTLNSWLILGISLVISALIISIFVKVLKAVLFVILVLALAPIIYLLIKSILPGKKPTDDDDKLKTRH